MPSSPGRPREASRELLQEAAFELFQLRGYRRTSVEQIARTAGFSRATFFNFFASKAELFWVETDALIDALREALRSQLERSEPAELADVLLQHVETIRSGTIPWALQNRGLLEANDDLIASGASRALEIQRLFCSYLRSGNEDGSEARSAASARAEAAALTELLLTALVEWIDAGVGRGALREHLELALRCVRPRSASSRA